MVLAGELQFSRLKRRSLKKIKPLTGFEPVPPRYLLAATISSTSTDRIILKIFLKNVVYKGKFTFSFKNSFAIYQKSDFNRSKISFEFTFHGVFLLTQDHIFGSGSYRGSVKFYRDTTQTL